MAVDNARERGPYLSANRAVLLERRIAAVEGRLLERCDQLERELAQQRENQLEVLRAMIGGLMTALRGQVAPPHPDDDEETR